MAQQHSALNELGRQIALLPFQNQSLKSFFRDELALLEIIGVPQLQYHEERVILCMAAAGFAIRAYLSAGGLSDEVSAGFASFMQEYGASAPQRQAVVQLLQRRVGGYAYGATLELMPPPDGRPQALIDEFALVLAEHAPSPKANAETARELAARYVVPLWHQEVERVGLALKAAGLTVQEG